MCDTLYKKLGGGESVFLKNSDRAVNEPNLVIYAPGRKSSGADIRCTYINVPDADAFACVLYKPSWTFGAEMGVNECGVAIGNEAVFTKNNKDKKTDGLIGMDYVRLALERADSAERGAEVILNLLEKYGQGGNCGYDHNFYYDNSYLIADKNEAYIVETAGKEWAVKKAGTQANISNRLSIREDYDKSSLPSGSFTDKYIEKVFSFFSGSAYRKAQGERNLSLIGESDIGSCLNALKSHNGNTGDRKLFWKGSVKSVCMHAGILGDHTTGSMAVFLGGDVITMWLTGSSSPCLSIYKPVYFGGNVPPVFKDERESLKYWLKRERLNRAIYAGYIDADGYRKNAAKLQAEFIEGHMRLVKSGADFDKLLAFSAECSEKEQKFVDGFSDYISEVENNPGGLPKYWRNKTKNLGRNVFSLSPERYGLTE